MNYLRLTNDIHNTQVNLKIGDWEVGDEIPLSASQARYAYRALCGMSDCQCSGKLMLGARGPSYINGEEIAVVDIKPVNGWSIGDGVYVLTVEPCEAEVGPTS